MVNRAVTFALAAVMICTGCLGGTPSAEPTETAPSPAERAVNTTGTQSSPIGTPTTAPPPTPRALPEKPANLTRETVVSFVIEYEEARLHNEQIRDGNYTDIEAGCRNRSIDATNGGFSVTISCRFALYGTSDEAEFVADGATGNITYTVDETAIERREE